MLGKRKRRTSGWLLCERKENNGQTSTGFDNTELAKESYNLARVSPNMKIGSPVGGVTSMISEYLLKELMSKELSQISPTKQQVESSQIKKLLVYPTSLTRQPFSEVNGRPLDNISNMGCSPNKLERLPESVIPTKPISALPGLQEVGKPLSGTDRASHLLALMQQSKSAQTENVVLRPSFNQKYQLKKVLGEGSSATVSCLLERDTNRMLAMKSFKNNRNWPGAMKEAQILSSLEHPNIIHFEKLIRTDHAIQLITEYFDGETLSQYIKKQKSKSLDIIPEQTLRQILSQLCDAMNHCHGRGVGHLDLKLDNVLISEDNRVKIIDFAFSRTGTTADVKCTTYCGTPNYMAPEVLNGTSYSPFQADVWAMGVLAYKLSSHGASPFRALDSKGILAKINESGSIETVLNTLQVRGYTREFCCFVGRMLNLDPNARATFAGLSADVWMTDPLKEVN